jgi:N-acetylmuramoyl-L-alanine amidase
MDTKTIICPTGLADELIKLKVVSEVTPPATPKPNTQATLEDLVAAVKRAKFEFPSLKAVCLAQWIVESGRGTSVLFREHNNAGGMKWREEMRGYATPIEYVAHDGKDTYCKFPSLDNWIIGYWRFIDRSPYAGWRNQTHSSEAYITHLKKCGYAEDPAYVKKVLENLEKARELLDEKVVQPDVVDPIPVLLDPGHSKSKPGASSNDGTAKEYELNVLQANIIKEILTQHGGFDVEIFNPDPDNLTEVGKRAKGKKLVIHLHHNKFSGNTDPGTEVLYDNDKAQPESKALALMMSQEISKALGSINRGAKPFSGTVMDVAEQQGNFPVVLTESYFLNPYSKEEAEKRSTIAARAIADVVKRWFA